MHTYHSAPEPECIYAIHNHLLPDEQTVLENILLRMARATEAAYVIATSDIFDLRPYFSLEAGQPRLTLPDLYPPPFVHGIRDIWIQPELGGLIPALLADKLVERSVHGYVRYAISYRPVQKLQSRAEIGDAANFRK